MNTTIEIKGQRINSIPFVKEVIEREIRNKISEKVNEIVNHFKSKGYNEDEIECICSFEPAFYDSRISDTYKLRVFGIACGVASQIFYVDFNYTFIHHDFSKDRNEEGKAVKSLIDESFKAEKEEKERIELDKKQAEEKAKQEKEETKEKLKLWALMNGTELLQLRIEENMNWYDLANIEYFKSILPEGFREMPSPDNSWEIKNATIEQIKALREVKKDHPEAKLMRYKYSLEPSNGEYFEDDEEETEHKDVIQITLKSISGEEKTFEKEL